MRPAIEWTDEMIVVLGRELAADPTLKGMERGEGSERRGLTNIEMNALLSWESIERRLARSKQKRAREGQPCST